MKNIRYWARLFCILFCLISVSTASWSQVDEKVDTRKQRDIVLYRGDLVTLKVYSLTRIAISTPGVVDIVNADVDEILLVGKTLGQTQIFIWDEYGKRSVLARVMEQDLDMVRERIERLLQAAEIKGITLERSSYEGKLIATGKVSKRQKEKFDKILGDLSQYVVNMVEEEQDLIQIEAQVVELNTTLQKVMGAEWSSSFSMAEVSYPTNQNGYFGDILKVGDIERTQLISATVNALLSTSKARTLSRPSLVVSDGEEASILVGGEVPVVTSTTSDGAVSENVNYKTYGVDLSVTPTIKDNNKIDVVLNVNIRDLGVTYGSNTAFTTTTTQTKVLLADGQTIILAGLIKKGESLSESRVPLLGSIPIIGIFFRYKNKLHSPDKEVVISLTPHIRRQKDKLKTKQELAKEQEIKDKAAKDMAEGDKKEEQAAPSAGGGDKAKASEAEEPSGDDGFWREGGLDNMIDNKMHEADSKGKNTEKETMKKKKEETKGGKKVEESTETVETEKSSLQNHDGGRFSADDMDAVLDKVETQASGEEAFVDQDSSSPGITSYAKDVQKKVAQKISFPFEAKEKGWDGVVTLSLTILSDGTLSDAQIKESSGHSIFDNDAINTAQIVSPFDPFPVEMEMDEITIDVPVSYSQEKFLIK